MTIYLWIVASVFYILAFSRLVMYAAAFSRKDLTTDVRIILVSAFFFWFCMATAGFYFAVSAA